MKHEQSLRILSVGQCGIDGPRIVRLCEEKLGAAVDCASTVDEAAELIADNDYGLVLVNRVLVADGSSGLDVIRELRESDAAPPVMLVSDQEDAQASAVELGAVPGFGKAKLDDPSTLECIRKAASTA